MRNPPKIDWHQFANLDPKKVKLAIEQFRKAAGYIAAVDKRFSQEPDKDRLVWIPGFQRMAGLWIQGEQLFRISLGLETYEIYIVDDKVNILDSISLDGLSTERLMLWLEGQIGKQGLNASDLEIASIDQSPFASIEELGGLESANIFHNSFVILRELRHQFTQVSNVWIYSENLNQELVITIKDSGDHETDTHIKLGLAFDTENRPHLFVKTQPFVSTIEFLAEPNPWTWIEDDWTGAKMSFEKLEGKDGELLAMSFFLQVSERLLKALKD